jgi:hypothetical protein
MPPDLNISIFSWSIPIFRIKYNLRIGHNEPAVLHGILHHRISPLAGVFSGRIPRHLCGEHPGTSGNTGKAGAVKTDEG